MFSVSGRRPETELGNGPTVTGGSDGAIGLEVKGST